MLGRETSFENVLRSDMKYLYTFSSSSLFLLLFLHIWTEEAYFAKNEGIRLPRDNKNRKCEEDICANENASGTKISKLIPEMLPKYYQKIFQKTIDVFTTRKIAKNIRTLIIVTKWEGDVNSFLESPCAFPFEIPSTTIYSMLRTTSD